jgi:hypothetical protein
MMIAQQIWEAMGDEERGQFSNFQEFFRSGIWKQILQQAQQDEAQGQQGIQSLGPRNMEPNRMGAEYGGRIGLYQGGGPHGDTELSKIVQFLMSEFGMSEEQAIKQATSRSEGEFPRPELKPATLRPEFRPNYQEPLHPKGLPNMGRPEEGVEDFGGLAQGGRIGFDNGGFTIDDAMAEEDRKVRESYKAYERYKASGGTKSYEEFMRMVGVGGLAQGGRIGARLGGDMEELSMRETIDTPEGIETLKETDTMQMAGGGARGWKAQLRAEEIAEEDFGQEFYDLSEALQHKIYNRALIEIDDMLADKIDMMRKE